MRDKTKLEMMGYWDAAKRAPLAEDHAIAEWKSGTRKEYAAVVLRDVRLKHVQSAAGEQEIVGICQCFPIRTNGATSIVSKERLTLIFLM